MTTHHWYSDAASWPDAAPLNYESAETVLDTWWNAIKGRMPILTKLAEYRWYREDDLEPPWGPPARVTGRSIAGTDSTYALPPQCAVAVTERTGLEEREEGRTVRHWGRFYLPALGINSITQDGTLSSAAVTDIANATDVMYAGMTACGLRPAVRITGWGGSSLPDSGWAPVKEIAVDNLVDTIRRRRYETVTLREVRDTFGVPGDPEN